MEEDFENQHISVQIKIIVNPDQIGSIISLCIIKTCVLPLYHDLYIIDGNKTLSRINRPFLL